MFRSRRPYQAIAASEATATGTAAAAPFSRTVTMRAFAALVLLASCSMAARNGPAGLESFAAGVLRYLDNGDSAKWPSRVAECTQTLGVAKCVKAFSAWRAGNAVESFATNKDARSDVTRELEQFPWQLYVNSTDEELGEMMSDGVGQLLRYRSLSLTVYPGLQLELDSKRNGTLNVDVCRTSEDGARSSSKKMAKQFYRIVPYLLVPGLIMSAILPFMLPALKMMTVGVGILNQMALSGAIFTLLRNNAFNDKYTKKIVYVNHGYNNEKHAPVYLEGDTQNLLHSEDYAGAGSNVQFPAEWMSHYYDESDVNIHGYKNRKSDRTRDSEGDTRHFFSRDES